MPMFALLDDDRIDQFGWRFQPWERRATTREAARGSMEHAIHSQQGLGIVWQIIAGEERNVLIEPIFQGFDEPGGIAQYALADPPSGDDFGYSVHHETGFDVKAPTPEG